MCPKIEGNPQNEVWKGPWATGKHEHFKHMLASMDKTTFFTLSDFHSQFTAHSLASGVIMGLTTINPTETTPHCQTQVFPLPRSRSAKNCFPLEAQRMRDSKW